MRKKILTLLFICFFVSGYSQQQKFGKVPFTKINKSENQKTNAQSFLANKLKPKSGIEFKQTKSKTDKKGVTHVTYQQYYRGIKVALGAMKLHQKNGINLSYNGTYFDVSQVNTSPKISKQQAITKAKSFFRNQKVFWLTENGFTDNPLLSINKIILPNRRTGNLNLAYAIGVGTFEPDHQMGILYIDAMNGAVLKFKNQVFACFEENHKENSINHIEKSSALPVASGTGYAAYSGSVNFETKLDASEYVLNDETRATGSSWNLSTQGLSTKTGIITLDMRTGTDYVNGPIYEFTDTDNNWTPAEMITDDNVYAIDVHWGSELVYDFWKNENSWNSYNGNNSALMSLVHYDNNLTNAAWGAISDTSGFMLYGDGAGSYTPLTTLDVVAHEIAHGVNNATSNLDYEYESGALNEGLSDIWAMVIENYANDNYGTTTDPSKINDQNAGGALRSFSNPNAYDQPDTYGGTYWYDITGCTPDEDTNDYCGVHTNSGVLNYWFWLLYNGGSGTNDIGSVYDVTAIDVYDAADIVWQMQTNYLTSTSDYADARDYAIQAAIDLFGTCSQEEESVTNAFYAVGVGNEYQSISPIITNQPVDLTIIENGSGQFSVTGTDYDTAQWLSSTDGNSWDGLTDDSVYSGTNTTTLTITNASASYDGRLYRILLENNCDNFIQSNEVTLNVTAYTSIADSNFEIALYALGYDDVSGDGQIPTNLIDTVTTLNLDGENISDLTGIEGFIALEELDADNNSLTSIDVSTLINLRVLRLDYNDLTTLDVTSNTDLETLSFRNNSITSIDLSNNTQLKDLRLQFNDVAVLDVTNNTAITTIICRANELTSIDLSQNTSLASFWAGDNNISSIDISGNSLLTVIQLYNNNLTYADLRNDNNINISNFSFTGNSSLSCILVDDVAYATTSFTSIDAHTSFSDTVCTEYTSIPDANFEAALGTLGYDDIANDGQVPTTLIEDVTYLDIYTQAISDLTGIEDFKALTFLEAGENQLTSVDLSNNVLLEYLDLYDNQIPTIDLSANTALTNVQIYDNDQISSIDLSNNTALTELIISSTPIASVDLSANVLLTNLDIQNTNITSIDLSANTLLEDLDIGDNSFTNLDISKNTALTDLDITNNNFTSLDVSANVLLEDLICFDNQITSLDLTSNINLIRVAVYNNNLSFLDVRNGNNTNITYFLASNNPNLQCALVDDIDFSNSNWSGVDDPGEFTETYCRYTTIPDANFEAWLENNGYDDISSDGQVPTTLIEAVTSVSVQYQNISDFTGIEDFTALESLTISYNNFTTLGVSNNLNLTFLNCGYSDLSSLDVSNNTLLETLWVNETDISTLDLSLNTNLTSLTASSMSNLTELNVKNGNNSNFTQFTTVASSNLSCIMVDDVAYSDTNWTNIESGTSFTEGYCNYTAIPDSNFEAALEALGYDDISSDSQVPTALIEVVTALHVSDENISNLTGIEDFTALVDLNVQDNSLSSLDLSNNLLLEDLNCASNRFFYLDLSNNVALNSLYANNGWLVELDVSGNPQLEYLYLADNAFLNSLNYQNGNNTNTQLFNTTGSSNLNCIVVDDAAYSSTNWTDIEAGTAFTDTYCDYTTIPDANFEAALEALGYDDISDDGQVPTALIEDITILDLSNKNITDLTGISNFEALNALDCSNNKLTEVDFGGNVPLTYLDLSSNNLTSLEAPTSVVNLIVNSNDLVYLDLTNHTDLEELSVNNNELVYLNLQNGNNTIIYNLVASDNIDLTCIIVDDVAHSTNNWNNIDDTTSFSTTYCKYTQIPDANFETRLENLGLDDVSGDGQVPTALIINQESINLSLSNSGAIYDLTGIQDFHELYNLILTDNLMTTVDLSANVKLGLLTANNTALTSVDLSSNVNMNYINLSDCDDLSSVNIQNGNNSKLIGDSSFTTLNVPNLSCVLVDDESYANATWINYRDAEISFNETYCNYTAIPDTNFEAWLESNGYDDISDDGQVPTSLIESITTLTLNNSSISDLTGIEDFTALTTLNCVSNALTTLDLSSNVNLSSLRCNSNSLTSLNISANTLLSELICSSNQLTTLDVTNNSQLTDIACNDNLLTTIDVSSNLLLKDFTVTDNSLTILDVSNNTALEILEFFGNSIAIIDLSANTLLFSIDFGDNPITSIDLSNNLALTEIYAYDANITGAFDLSNHPLLIDVDFTNNELSSLDIRNGNNENIDFFDTRGNNNLSCISVDDVDYSTTNWTNIDADHSFSEDNYCRYTTIPDANFEVRLETLGYDDISGDGQVPTVLIEVVTDLKVSNKSISDLKGIEAFTALKTLNCEGNSITSLDLSNNLLLETIDCDSNDLTSLEFGNNTVLKTLICNKSNNLGTLDVSSNTGLEYIQLTNNGLTSIDVNGLTALTTLSVDYNSLTAIDVSTTTALEILTCANNSFSSLDLSNNVNLTYILASNNSLTNLDVTNSTELAYLYCTGNAELTTLDVTNNSSLLRLTASSNSLSTIDVSNNVLLEKLWINDNEITNLSVDTNTALTELVCYNNEISTLNVSNNTLLDWLYCDGNKLTSLDLTANTVLTSFNCSNNALTSLNLQNENNTKLTFSVFTDNPNLTCVQVDDAAYSTTNWTNIDDQTSFSETSCSIGIQLAATIFLQGAATNPNSGEEDLMRDDLRVSDLLPTTSPYTDAITCETTVFDITGSNAIIDWIWVELRDATDNTIVVDSQSALLQRDGNIVAIDGVSSLSFEQAEGDYYIVIKHRNHLGIMSAITVSLTTTATTIDFSANSGLTFGGTNSLIDLETGTFAMPSGDYDGNTQVQNTDVSTVTNLIGNPGYNKADMDMNGEIQNTDINSLMNPNIGKGEQF